jgi:hypothetical protein
MSTELPIGFQSPSAVTCFDLTARAARPYRATAGAIVEPPRPFEGSPDQVVDWLAQKSEARVTDGNAQTGNRMDVIGGRIDRAPKKFLCLLVIFLRATMMVP